MNRIDPTTARYFIVDEEGTKHRIFPMRIADKDAVIPLFDKFTDTNVIVNLLIPKLEEDGSIARDANGNIIRDDSAYEAMMELMELATREKREDILKWLDVVTAQEAVELFVGISQLKKKQDPMT